MTVTICTDRRGRNLPIYIPESDRIRYTIAPEARKELLHRLLLLNHERHEEELEAAALAKEAGQNRVGEQIVLDF